MAYARFGDNSDVYVYQSFKNYVVHFAHKRLKEGVVFKGMQDFPLNSSLAEKEKYVKEYMEYIENCYEPIIADWADKSYSFDTLQELYEFLSKTIACDCRIPKSCFERIEKELKELK